MPVVLSETTKKLRTKVVKNKKKTRAWLLKRLREKMIIEMQCYRNLPGFLITILACFAVRVLRSKSNIDEKIVKNRSVRIGENIKQNTGVQSLV